MHRIYVIHENPAWLPPLSEAFDQRRLPWAEWFLDAGVFDLASPPPEGVFYNRMSASSHTRDHRYLRRTDGRRAGLADPMVGAWSMARAPSTWRSARPGSMQRSRRRALACRALCWWPAATVVAGAARAHFSLAGDPEAQPRRQGAGRAALSVRREPGGAPARCT